MTMNTLKSYLNKETILSWSTLGWLFTLVVTFMMLVGGVSKIVGTEEMVGNFEYMKLSPYLLMVGLMELVGGIMLMVPRLSKYGAVLIGSVMSAAVCMHLSLSMPNTTLPLMLGALALLGYKLRS